MKRSQGGSAAPVVPSVKAAIRILDHLLATDQPMGVSELSRGLGLSKATTYRIVHTLAAADYLERGEERDREKYQLGPKLMQLGSAVLARLDVTALAMPGLEALVRQFGEEAHVGVLVQGEVVYVSRVETHLPRQMAPRVGFRAPAHCTSIGKVLLAYAPQRVVAHVLESGLRQYTSATLTTPAALLGQLQRVQENGYATSFEEFEVGLNSIAAPIRDHTGAVVAAMGLSGPAHRMTAARMQSVLPMLLNLTRDLSRDLGYLPPSGDGRAAAPDTRVLVASALAPPEGPSR